MPAIAQQYEDNKMKNEHQYEVIIIGGSYAGLSAGMALGRALRKVLIVDSGNPCNKQTPYSHNFITNDGKTPKEIASFAKQQVSMYDTVVLLDGLVTAGTKIENGFELQTQTGETFSAGKLVFATGIKDMMPNIPGFAECWGISVLHCPYCHGYEVHHEKTGILGNGDSAFEMSSLISNWTDDLTLYTNGEAALSNQHRMKLAKHTINVAEEEIERLEHKNGYVQYIVFRSGRTAPVKALYTGLPFQQHSDVSQALHCELTKEGYLKIDPSHNTTVPGIFACGDNVSRMRTVANAVSMGTTTGLMVNKELINEYF